MILAYCMTFLRRTESLERNYCTVVEPDHKVVRVDYEHFMDPSHCHADWDGEDGQNILGVVITAYILEIGH